MESKQFKAIDLHVHTPSSSCYKGKCNTDEEYFEIINKYVSEGVRLIAITDHNTIEGYKKIIEIRNKLSNLICELELIQTEKGLPINDISTYKKKYEIFERICILPGVELEVNPGIHLLVVFNDETEINDIEHLLFNIGYGEDCIGHDKMGNIQIDVLDVFSMLSDIDAIVIGAHVDSDKGIYNNTEGQYRAQIFRHERLNGVQYLNQKNADQIKNMLGNKEYNRNSPLAFIKSSDFHGNYEEKAEVVYVDLEVCNYENLRKAFQSPEQSISLTENPDIKSILENLLKQDNTLCIEIKNSASFKSFAKELCAVLNVGFGSLVLGVLNNKYQNIVGVDFNTDHLTKLVENSAKELDANNSTFELYINYFSWGNKTVYVINAKNTCGKTFHLKDNTSYLIENGIAVQASIKSIIEKAESNIVEKIKNYMDRNNKRISKLTQELTLLSDLNSCFNFIMTIENIPISIFDIVNIDFVRNVENVEFCSRTVMGTSDYNVIIPEDHLPRYDYSYLRFTPYGIKVDDEQFEKLDSSFKFSGDCILIMPRGAVYLVTSKCEYYLYTESTSKPYIRVTLKDDYTKKGMYQLLAAWLKCSLLLFYTYVRNESISIYENRILKNTPPLIGEIFDKEDQLITIVNEIISKEEEFLDRFSTSKEEIDALEKAQKYDELEELNLQMTDEITLFNESISYSCFQIDRLIYEHFKVDNDSLNVITRFLDLNNLYSFQEFDEEFYENMGQLNSDV